MLDRYTNTGYLAEVQGIEPSTLRWHGFQDRLSTLLAYLLILIDRRLAHASHMVYDPIQCNSLYEADEHSMDEAAATVHKPEGQLLLAEEHTRLDDYHRLSRCNQPRITHQHLPKRSSSLHFSMIW